MYSERILLLLRPKSHGHEALGLNITYVYESLSVPTNVHPDKGRHNQSSSPGYPEHTTVRITVVDAQKLQLGYIHR